MCVCVCARARARALRIFVYKSNFLDCDLGQSTTIVIHCNVALTDTVAMFRKRQHTKERRKEGRKKKGKVKQQEEAEQVFS